MLSANGYVLKAEFRSYRRKKNVVKPRKQLFDAQLRMLSCWMCPEDDLRPRRKAFRNEAKLTPLACETFRFCVPRFARCACAHLYSSFNSQANHEARSSCRTVHFSLTAVTAPRPTDFVRV